MPNGDDIPRLQDRFRSGIGRDLLRRLREEQRDDPPETGAGFPAPVVPLFPPLPTTTTVPPRAPVRIIFPSGPAANDPVFSRAGGILRIGNVVVGIAIILDQLIRKAQDLRIEQEERERESVFQQRIRERALQREPLIVEFPAPRVDPPPFDPADIPSQPRTPQQQPGGTPLEIPGVQVPGIPAPAPAPISVPGPTAPTAPKPATVPAPVPATIPGIGSQVGVFTPPLFPGPITVGVPSPVPGLFPSFRGAEFPVFEPIGDPLTAFEPGGVASQTTSTFADVLEFPQPVPQTQPARRCRPCPKEDPPTLRDACFKGLYREGPFTDDVDFVEWAEINCVTGEEI